MEDLVRRIKECDPCYYGLTWVYKQKSKEDILNNCPQKWKLWAIQKGVLDFVDCLNYEDINGEDISYILKEQPKLINKFDLDKLKGEDIYWILRTQPHLIDKFDLSKLNKDDISYLLKSQPKLEKYFVKKGK
jgi:hypothetical protein